MEDLAQQNVFTRIKPVLQGGVQKNLERISLKATSNCWICEGWTQMQFTFETPEWVNTEIVPIKLHLSCDNYVGEYLGEDEKLTEASNKIENERLAKEKEDEIAEELRKCEGETDDNAKAKFDIKVDIGD